MSLAFGSERYAYLSAKDDTEEIEWDTKPSRLVGSARAHSLFKFSKKVKAAQSYTAPEPSMIMDKYQRLQISQDDGKTCVLDILDTAGQEEYSSLRDQYVRQGNCFLVLYDVTKRDTFAEALKIFEWIRTVKNEKEIVAMLCGNKIDLVDERVVSTEEGQQAADQTNVRFAECSAKTGSNVQEVFADLIKHTPRIGTHYKVPVLGPGSVGKTAVTMRYCNDAFLDIYDPTIEDTYTKVVQLEGLKTAVASGKSKVQSKFRRPKSLSMKQGEARDNRSSWTKMKDWLTFWKHDEGEHMAECPPVAESLHLKDDEDDVIRSNNFCDVDLAIPQEQGATGGASHKSVSGPPKNKVQVKAPTCNVLAVSLCSLEDDLTITTGDAVLCNQCGAVMTHFTAGLTPGVAIEYEGQQYKWKCRFCDFDNTFNGGCDELNEVLAPLPAAQYLMSPPDSQLASEMTTGLLVYCIDVSGSMNQRVYIPASQAEWRKVKRGPSGDDGNADCPSRLQCIKQAILRQLERTQIESPSKRVVIVTFESHVQVHQKSLPIQLDVAGMGVKELIDTGARLGITLQPIRDSYSEIVMTVEHLSPQASTALGPALTVCCGLASTCPFSEIVLCTDGEPNIGVGALNTQNKNNDESFYTEIGERACGQDTKISLIALEGQEVNMNIISRAATNSGGNVTVLNPIELARQVRLISQRPVIATKTGVELYTHPCVKFVDSADVNKPNYLNATVGNVTTDTEVCYFYELNKNYKDEIPQHIPFQIQIKYAKLDGSIHLRVLAQQRETTENRQDMEETCNIAVVAMASNKMAAKQAEKGNVDDAQKALCAASNMIDRCSTTTKKKEEQHLAYQNMLFLDQQLTAARRKETEKRSDRMTHVYSKVQSQSLTSYENSHVRGHKLNKAHSRTSKALNDVYYSHRDSDSS